MGAQGSRIILYSDVPSPEEDRLVRQLAEIGYDDAVKIDKPRQLKGLVLGSPCPALVLLLTNTDPARGAVLEILGQAGDLPVIGLFSQHVSLCDHRIVDACGEVATWPCSNPELDYRLRKITDCCPGQDSGLSLFVKMNILGNSPEFSKVLERVCKIRHCDAPVFIDGETGTGKELIARAIHYLSKRRDMPFVAANCGAFPDQLIENEFFGHDRGAYTDARESTEGLIAQAEGGTLFLDELETLSARGQVSLLRFLENMSYRPLGSKSARNADLRVITATNENIADLVEAGSFRRDLYYRINIMNIVLPPLRMRTGDINLLADYFIRKYRRQYNQPEKELHPDTRSALKYHDWPGNVRELENVLHREFVMAEGKYITIDDIEARKQERRTARCDRRWREILTRPMIEAKKYLVDDFERQYLSRVLDRANGNISEAARLAGKERRSFTRLLEKYHLNSGSQDKARAGADVSSG